MKADIGRELRRAISTQCNTPSYSVYTNTLDGTQGTTSGSGDASSPHELQYPENYIVT